MINCFQFCFKFAFNFNLRRYTLAQLASRSSQYATGLASKFEAGAAELLKVGSAHGSYQCL
jgi:hypothetical protein